MILLVLIQKKEFPIELSLKLLSNFNHLYLINTSPKDLLFFNIR